MKDSLARTLTFVVLVLGNARMGFVSKDIFKSFWQDLVDEYITSIDPCLFYYEALVKNGLIT